MATTGEVRWTGHFRGASPMAFFGGVAILMQANGNTKRLTTKQNLALADNKYRHFMNIISDGVLLIDQAGYCLSANEVISKLFSVEITQIVGRYASDVFQDVGIPELGHLIKDIGHKDTSLSSVQSLIKANNELLWLGIKGYALDEGVILIISDITQRINAEKALESSEERNRLLVDNTNEGILIIQNGNIKFFNNKVCEILNYSVGKFEELNFWDIIYSDDLEKLKTNYLSKIKGDNIDENIEFRAVDSFGSTRWLYANLVAIEWEDHPAILAFLTDITLRKEAEQALLESEQRFRRLLDNAPDLIIRLSLPNGEYQYVSPSAENITGYCADDFFNNPLLVRDIMHPDWKEYFEKSWADILRGEAQPRYEYQAYTKSRETRWFSQSNILIKDDSGKPIALEAIVRDITDYREAQIALQSARENLEAQVKVRTSELEKAIEVAEAELSQRKAFEEALQESEKTLRSILEATNDVAILVDDKLRIVLANARTTSLISGEPHELIRLRLPDQFQSDCRKKLESCLHYSMANAEPYECEMVFNQRTYIINIYPVTSPHDESLRAAVFMRDITYQRDAERALAASEKRFRAVVQSQTELICRFLPDGTLTFANQAYCRLSRKPPDNILGNNIWEFIAPFKQPRLKELLSSLNERNPTITNEQKIISQGGRPLWFSWTTVAFFDDDGNVMEFQSVATDITQRHLTEKALINSEHRYLSFFENNPVMMLIVDPSDGKILDANSSAREFYGYSEEEFESLRINDITVHSYNFITSSFTDGRLPDNGPIQFKHKSKYDDNLDVELFYGTIQIDDKEVICCIIYDINARIKREQKLVQYQKQLRTLSSELTLAEERERRNLAADLHDNIVQSLTLCDLKLKMAITQLDKAPQHLELNDVQSLLSETISNIRTLTFDLSPPILYELGLKPAIEWLCENLQSQYSLDITINESNHFPEVEDNAAVLLFRAVRELLLNIIKHASAEHAQISFMSQHGVLIIRIEDDGIGFEDIDTENMLSKGLGLFSIKERLQAFNGLIKIRSWPGHGSCIDIVVPMDEYTGAVTCQ